MIGSCFKSTNFTVANFILHKLRGSMSFCVFFFSTTSKAVQTLLSEVQANDRHADVYQLLVAEITDHAHRHFTIQKLLQQNNNHKNLKKETSASSLTGVQHWQQKAEQAQ